MEQEKSQETMAPWKKALYAELLIIGLSLIAYYGASWGSVFWSVILVACFFGFCIVAFVFLFSEEIMTGDKGGQDADNGSD